MNRSLRPAYFLALLLIGSLFQTSCMSPAGDTVAEQRASAAAMREEALAALYADKPDLKEKLEKAAGNAVFKNFSIHPGLLSFANGYGVLTNSATGETNHLKWTRLTIGPGIAVKGMYLAVLFDDAKTMEAFKKGPWVAGGQMEASFVFGDFGGGLEKAWAFKHGVHVYYTTHDGVALELELFGVGKVGNNKELNQKPQP